MERKLMITILIGFIVGYIFGSWALFISLGISPVYLEGPNEGKDRKFLFLHSLNPFEPMSPGFYMMVYSSP